MVLLGAEWLWEETQTQNLWATAENHRYPTPLNTGMWSASTSKAVFTDIAACYAVLFPFPTFLIHGEPSPKSRLGEETRKAPGRVPAGNPIIPSEDTLPMCGQSSSPRGPNMSQQSCWDVGEVGDRVKHGELDQKWARDSGLHSP